jgi:hypothetical protein
MTDRHDSHPPIRPVAPTTSRKTPSMPGRLLAKLPRRLRVIGPGVVAMIVVTVLGCLAVALRLMTFAPELLVLAGTILTGPVAGMLAQPGDSAWLVIVGLNASAILAHPAWPNRGTAAVTMLAMASWLFWGSAVAFSSV